MVWDDVETLSSHKIWQRWVKVLVGDQGSIKFQGKSNHKVLVLKSGRVNDMVSYSLVALKIATVQYARNLFLVDINIFITAPTTVAIIASIFQLME